MWPNDAQIYYAHWQSRFALAPGAESAELEMRIADDVAEAAAAGLAPSALLTLDLKGINHLGDIEVRCNGTPAVWDGYHYNHWDHGTWTDIVRYTVPPGALRKGENSIGLFRLAPTEGFDGPLEVRKCILELKYPKSFAPGRL